MKDTANQYVALDVHQATLVVSVRDESGSIRMHATVPTEQRAIVDLLRGLSGRIHVAFEEGTQSQWLHDVIKPNAERVVVCNLRGQSQTTNKSDRLDADRLSELLRIGSLKAVYHGASELTTLKELMRSYVNLVEDSTRVMLRIKALFRARAIKTPGTSVYRAAHRKEWLAKLENRGARARAAGLYAELDVLEELRPKAKTAMMAEARRQPGWKPLLSIPFLGPIRVSTILAIVATPWRFRTKRQTVVVRWVGGGHVIERRRGVRGREVAPAEARAAHTRAQSKSQPETQGSVQGGHECGGVHRRTAEGKV